ncbi:MAG: SDR family oxidoreductase [Acidobacteria bacterium]|nr:SDR family oxidoreductase [Acidobacteriota bacterium]
MPGVDLFGLDGRTALVTGASSGLGDRFARALHGAGATVVVTARRADRLEALAADLGDRVVVLPADLADAGAREALVRDAIRATGALDVLVNNAGYGVPVPAVDESIEQLEVTMAVNVTAPFHLCQLAGRHMLERGSGSIINIASIFGMVGSAPLREVAYCVSKGAIVNMTRQLGCEWSRGGVRVNAVAPGWFPTEMTQESMFDQESGRSYIERNTPIGRAGELHELDGPLLFLASDASTYVTGEVLAVDGGWLAR